MWNQQQPMYNPYLPQQAIQQVQKSAQFYNVDSAQELDGIRPSLNVLYVGFNKHKKEIYVKQLTNDGLISVDTYNIAENKKEKTEYEIIIDKINELENKLLNKGVANVSDNATNVTDGSANVNVG